MGALLTICPLTGRNVETGIETDKRTLAGTSRFAGRFTCRRCGREHVISRDDVWVCDTIAGVPQFYPEP